MDKKTLFQQLPGIDTLLDMPSVKNLFDHYPERIVKDAVRETVAHFRNAIVSMSDENVPDLSLNNILDQVSNYTRELYAYSLQTTLNGTGTIGHTNLGRAILAPEAIAHMLEVARNYSNLEYNLQAGKRGSRYTHIVSLLKRLTGCEDALVVNNNAAAVFLILNSLAEGKQTIVSRGELVEIGDSFRISSIMSKSGSHLIEVGASNKTHLFDYEEAINDDTAILMKVHRSNFSLVGFHEEVSVTDLKALSVKHPRHPIVVEDLGSGTLLDFTPFGLSPERTVKETLQEGVDLVSFSGDKILGGPQAGIILGRADLIHRIKKNQLLRAFRVDKLTIAALEATLRLYYDEDEARKRIPSLHLMTLSREEIEEKARQLRKNILECNPEIEVEIVDARAQVGGGAFPAEWLPSKALCIRTPISAARLEKALRLAPCHLIGMISDDVYHIDVRCLFEQDFPIIAETIREVLQGKEKA